MEASNHENASTSPRWSDALAVSTLALTGAVVGWPVLNGGYITYLDNPAHLAEAYAAAFEAHNGWSEIAFCGFPIGSLHSPLWYGALSLLARAGLPVGPLYAFCLWLGFVAPPVALYFLARRSLAPLSAAILGMLLLVQRPAIVGIGSAFGGMWTFYIAAAALIALIGRLSRPCRPRGDLAWIAGLVGFIILTHLYAVVPLAILAFYHAWIVVGRRRSDRGWLGWQVAAVVLGILAAAAYWVPLVIARGTMVVKAQNLAAGMVAARLAIPTHVLDLVNGELPALTPSLLAQAAPMVVLLLAGILGVLLLPRRTSDAPLYGTLLAATLLTLLLFVTGEFDLKILGPGSWRMLYFVRVGIILAAIPLAERLAAKAGRGAGARFNRPLVAAAALVAVTVGWWAGAPLRAVTPATRGPEMIEVESLWRWLDENKSSEWGRVYLQDTFDQPLDDVALSQSHILALTAHRTGVRKVGAVYGVAPYLSSRWTPSEFGTLFRGFVRDEEDVDRVKNLLWRVNGTHVVTSDARTEQVLEASEWFEKIHKTGRFAVFRAVGVSNEWASPLHPGVEIRSVEFGTGRYQIKLVVTRPGDVLVKTSYHPYWRFSGVPRIGVRIGDMGLMQLTDLTVGEHDLAMLFRPARWPGLVGGWAWLLILWLFYLGRRRTAPRP